MRCTGVTLVAVLGMTLPAAGQAQREDHKLVTRYTKKETSRGARWRVRSRASFMTIQPAAPRWRSSATTGAP